MFIGYLVTVIPPLAERYLAFNNVCCVAGGVSAQEKGEKKERRKEENLPMSLSEERKARFASDLVSAVL